MRDVKRSDPASPTQRVALLRWMIGARLMDERIATLYRQGAIPGKVFLGKGQEALSAALGMHLIQPEKDQAGDIFAPLIRDMAGRLAFGETALDIARVHFMRLTGDMRGRDGNIHRGNLNKNILPMISHLGSMLPAVCGMLMARRLRGDLGTSVGATCIGDGGMQTGAFHEGLNVAAVEKLPLVVVAADNQVSYSTFSDRTYACASLVDRAIGYGIRGYSIDGTDADACLRTLHEAVQRARAGEGPQLIVATLLRGSGHGEHDDASYVPASLKAQFADSLTRYEHTLVAAKVVSESDIIAWRNEATAAIRTAFQTAQAEPEPTVADENWQCLSSKDLSRTIQEWETR